MSNHQLPTIDPAALAQVSGGAATTTSSTSNDQVLTALTGILDSITTLKLVVFLEEHFGITVEAHEAGVEHLDSIHQIAELVAEKKQAA